MPRSRAIFRTGGLARTLLTRPLMAPPRVGRRSMFSDGARRSAWATASGLIQMSCASTGSAGGTGPAVEPAAAAGVGAGAATRRRRLTASALGPEPTSGPPAGPPADSPASEVSASSFPYSGASGAGAAVGAGAASAATASLTLMIGVPTSTVRPSGTSSSVTVPANGEGSSTRDFAVSISHRTSLMATVSPGLTFQATISASVSPSPTSGRLNLWRVMLSLLGEGASMEAVSR
ncbi:hypothetical protein BJQ90_02009 [Arthrobacter sp. SO3]|nr:hypothetical protein [Arthrobacter sp. SO3]